MLGTQCWLFLIQARLFCRFYATYSTCLFESTLGFLAFIQFNKQILVCIVYRKSKKCDISLDLKLVDCEQIYFLWVAIWPLCLSRGLDIRVVYAVCYTCWSCTQLVWDHGTLITYVHRPIWECMNSEALE